MDIFVWLFDFTDILAQLWQFVFYAFNQSFETWRLMGVNGLGVIVTSIRPPYSQMIWYIPNILNDFLAGFASVTGVISTIFIDEQAPFFFHFVFSGTAVSLFVGVVRVVLGWVSKLFD